MAEEAGQGLVVLATGGGTGMALEMNKILAGMGYDRFAVTYGHKASDAEEGAATLRSLGATVSAYPLDLAQESQVEAVVEQVYQEYGRVDLLINSAATTRVTPWPDLKAVDGRVWDEIMDVNVKGLWLMCRAVGMRMVEGNGGSILNFSSGGGVGVGGSSIPYSVSKAAVVQITRTLAVALAPKVRVNCLAPSMIMTRWWAGHDATTQRYLANTRFKRFVTAEQAAQAGVMLATNEGMSGQTVVVDLANTMH